MKEFSEKIVQTCLRKIAQKSSCFLKESGLRGLLGNFGCFCQCLNEIYSAHTIKYIKKKKKLFRKRLEIKSKNLPCFWHPSVCTPLIDTVQTEGTPEIRKSQVGIRGSRVVTSQVGAPVVHPECLNTVRPR